MTKEHTLPKDAKDLCIIKTELCSVTAPSLIHLMGLWPLQLRTVHNSYCLWVNAIRVHEFDFEYQTKKGHCFASVSRQNKVDQLECETGQLTMANTN